MPRDRGAPYAQAVADNAAQDQLRLNVPGHSADAGSAPELIEFFGEDTVRKDISPLLGGVDLGPDNPLSRATALAAEAWGARRTWFLTNGASQANRMGALVFGALGGPLQQVVVQRSAHSSFIDGIILAGLTPAFAQPLIDDRYGIAHGLSPRELARVLAATNDPKGVYVVTPSYFGAVADVAALAEVAHAAGVPIMVDEAWGAHFGFHEDLPANALSRGADLVVSSTHKLGGSLTQSAMLHLGDGPFGDALEPLVQRALMITMSTSPSSLLLSSLDIARQSLQTGWDRIGASIAAAERIRTRVRDAGVFGIVSDTWDFEEIVATDPLRVSIDVRRAGFNGHAVREELMRTEGIYTEISTDSCIVAFLGPGYEPDVDRFVDALHRLEPVGRLAYADTHALPLPHFGRPSMRPRDAWFSPAVTIGAREAVGRVSADTLAAYPPGIPNLLPGEIITAEVVDFLRTVAASPGGHVRGAIDPAVDRLRVVEN
ncbi:arginine/lysine/ornithine decarboxylase [Cryobacterium mesophilum]|uniref:aminotransferase class I/II-fold pyridoxal phosphate-dependent enzyme n=1 Tax=Terrimesophilobacter mesophilus TaxID=433647 RepID=UPI0017996FCA|nr:PLP-dependent transferase [Terrimesophilobacter mesophilus]MBB5633511.1 arginine/lysine/ornithine decarboxylase [Terrimesophilobacter mesophilus]